MRSDGRSCYTRGTVRLRSAFFASLLVLAPFAALVAQHADGAENFACGAGGRPNPKTARCDCPGGKVERTVGGTSRCVEKPAPTSTTTSTATAPTSAPTSTTMPTTTATTPPTGTVTMPTTTATPPTVSCPAGKMATPSGCVDLCAADEMWTGSGCGSRCGHDEIWNGARCERTTRPAPKAKCPDEQISDAGGRCCWPGQTYGEESRRCRGIPRCPATHRAEGESCVLAECAPGQRRVGDAVHCCWEGQEWSRATRRCVGIPECPEGSDLQGETCVAWKRCDSMHVAVDREHCCFAGQHWGVREDGTSGCAGKPRCRRGFVAQGEECVSEEKADADAELETKSSLLGARMIGLGFVYGYLRFAEGFSGHAFGYGMQYHLKNVPLMFRGSLEIGIYRHTGTGADSTGAVVSGTNAGSLYSYSLGVAFAPLSLPSAATNGTSLLNPFVGLDFYGVSYKYDSTNSKNGDVLRTPSGGTGMFLSLGNTFSLIDDKKNAAGVRGGLSLTVSYGLQVLAKDDDRISSRLSLVGMYSAF